MDDCDLALFDEPADFRPKEPENTRHKFTRANGDVVEFSLIGRHSLWAHVAWNAGKWLANYIDQHPDIVLGKNILELGAGAALPSIVAVHRGAKYVVATDYPDQPIIDMLQCNMDRNCAHDKDRYIAQGYLWGSDIHPLLPPSGELFDVVLMCDLAFNHSQHENMLDTCLKALRKPHGIAYCAFTHHRPWLADKDMDFLRLAREKGFDVEHLTTDEMEVMFEQDPGDEQVRRQVKVYRFKFNDLKHEDLILR